MDFPRSDMVRKELSDMGAVYVIVFVILVAALLYAWMPDSYPPADVQPGVGIGPPTR